MINSSVLKEEFEMSAPLDVSSIAMIFVILMNGKDGQMQKMVWNAFYRQSQLGSFLPHVGRLLGRLFKDSSLFEGT